jgi:hypothetical protein
VKATEEKTVPGSTVEFSLELESHLPRPLTAHTLQVSLAFAAPKKVPPPGEADRRKGVSARGVQRSPSAASNSNTSVLRL